MLIFFIYPSKIFDSEDEEQVSSAILNDPYHETDQYPQDPNDFADRNRRRPSIGVAPSKSSSNLRRRTQAKTLAAPSLATASSAYLGSFDPPSHPSFETDQYFPNNNPLFEGAKPISSELPTQAPSRIKHENLDEDIQLIEVKVRQADGSEEFKYVHLMKSEDGQFDIFNTNGFDLRPPIEVGERYNVGFTRTVISHVSFELALWIDESMLNFFEGFPW